MEVKGSTPNLIEFDPAIIPYQLEVLDLIRFQFNYRELGVLEILLSGSYGSAKSLLMTHAALTHVTMFPRSRFCFCRKTMPDLKDTIWQKFLEHMEGVFIEGHHYEINRTATSATFWNNSEVITRSWADKKYRKFRSLELSAAGVEELTENDSEEFESFYKELLPRVGRLPHVPESFIISATNPDSPAHPAYDWFFKKHPNRRTFLSRTDQNPFLPPTYVNQLMETLTAQEIRRYVYGEWIEIKAEVIYYAYDPSLSAILSNYDIRPNHPIYISFDFNIGHGKPMSATISQFIGGSFFFLDEVIVHGARTLDIMEEINARGYLDYPTTYTIHGDATGRRRDTRSIHSDYEVITKYLANLENNYGPIRFEIDVPRSNPPVRTRHTIVNGQLKNAMDRTHVYLDPKKCKMLDKGLKLTKLKKGGQYIEDDSPEYQHVTTAIGYHICKLVSRPDPRKSFKKTRVV